MRPNWNNSQGFAESLVDPLKKQQFEQLEQHRKEFVMRRTWDNSEGTYRSLWASVLVSEQLELQQELTSLRSRGPEGELPFTPEHG